MVFHSRKNDTICLVCTYISMPDSDGKSTPTNIEKEEISNLSHYLQIQKKRKKTASLHNQHHYTTSITSQPA